MNAWGRQDPAAAVTTPRNEAPGVGDDAGERDVSDAADHLLRASASVDRLLRGEPVSRADQASFLLCEAGLAIDRALAALHEWSKTMQSQSPPTPHPDAMRPDIERVMAQEIRRALHDAHVPPGPSPVPGPGQFRSRPASADNRAPWRSE
jgi:hypothetical protein